MVKCGNEELTNVVKNVSVASSAQYNWIKTARLQLPEGRDLCIIQLK